MQNSAKPHTRSVMTQCLRTEYLTGSWCNNRRSLVTGCLEGLVKEPDETKDEQIVRLRAELSIALNQISNLEKKLDESRGVG